MEIVKGQPLKLPDGSILLPDASVSGNKVIKRAELEAQEETERITQEINDAVESADYNAAVKRTLADVTVDTNKMNVIILVVAYTLWGLNSFAVSRLINASVEQVEALQSSDLYMKTLKEMQEAVRYNDAATVHGYLSSKAISAAKVVAGSLVSPSADIRLAAAKDLLDRSGFRPADRVEHVHMFEDELRIRYMRDEGDIPTITIDAE